jgi:hypothetical protein
MLVDPARPDVAYTLVDVRARTNTGWATSVFGEALLVAGGTGLVFGFKMDLALLRIRRSAAAVRR